jgi:protein ImuB
VEARGLLWVDTRGLPASRIAHLLLARLNVGKAEVRAGVADVPIAAEVAARSSEGTTVVECGYERAFLAPLSLDLLSPDPKLWMLLQGVGVRTCGDLARLPREAVEVRFGAEGTHLWRLARADDPRLLFRPIPGQRPHASMDFVDYQVQDAARLVFTVNSLLGNVCETLRARGQRARRLMLAISLGGGGVLREEIRSARPTSDRSLWLERVRLHLDRLVLPDTVAGVALEVADQESASASQGDLFDRGFSTAAAVEETAARLVDRLGSVFVRPQASAHPLIERRGSWQPLAVAELSRLEKPPTPSASAGLWLQLLAEPRSIQVRIGPSGARMVPVRYLDRGEWKEIVDAAGPDRQSGGHDSAGFAREYYRCATDENELLWIFHDALTDGWFLHGWWG